MRKIIFLLLAVLCIGCKDKGSREELDMRYINSMVDGANKSFEKAGLEGYAEYDGENIVYNIYSDLPETEFLETFADIEDLRDELVTGLQGVFAENKYKDRILDVLTRKDCHIVYRYICYENPELACSIDISPEEYSQ